MTNPVRSQCVETTRVGPAAIAADGRLGAARLGRWGGGADEEGGLCTVALLLALCAGVVLVPTGAQWAQLSVTLLAFERAALLPLVGLVGSRMGVHSKDAFDVVVALGTWVALGLSRAGGAGGVLASRKPRRCSCRRRAALARAPYQALLGLQAWRAHSRLV